VSLAKQSGLLRSKTRSLRVAVVGRVAIRISSFFAFVFLLFVLWFSAKEDIGIYPRIGWLDLGTRIYAWRTALEGSPAHRQSS
jgi:hypothetical protein